MTTAEICDRQTEIIKAQADIIDELFLQVIEYTDIENEEKVLFEIQKVEEKEARLWKQ